MKRFIAGLIILLVWSTNSFAHSAGGDVKIVNSSDYQLTTGNSYSTKMDKWKFPASIQSHQTIQTRIEFNWPWFFGTPDEDKGTVNYQVACASGQQTISLQTIVVRLEPGIDGIYQYAAGIEAYRSGANCVSFVPADGQIGFKQNGLVTLTITNS